MPYKDYEQQKARARALYHQKTHGVPAPPLKPRMTEDDKRKWQKEHRNKPEVKQRKRDTELRRVYGITWDDKVRMYQEQEGLCGLCGQPLDAEIGKACVDHNHVTREIRKLLHKWCNCVVAYFEEDISRMATMTEYLKKGK